MDSSPTPIRSTVDRHAHNIRAIKAARASIETRLKDIIPSAQTWPVQLHAAQRHALLSPGKRFRPLLCVFVAKGAGFEGTAATYVGCVSEMVHAASLILDDLPCMDDAALRRNQPTTHIAFDESTAILTATALLNRAFGVLAQLPDVSAERRIELVDLLSYAVGSKGLIAGQIADLSNTDTSASVAEIERLNTLKTGALFDFAIEGAAIIAGVSASQRGALKDFSHHLGLAFQLLDDVKDTVMSDAEAEKSVGRDTGKATILALTGSEAAMERLSGYITAAKEALGRAKLSNSDTLDAVLDAQFAFLK
ncbi:polyprenyl synthetase family protein [Fretibacter rubidus]|uniref:polyprenyl synthetase family protein n=1 Tax=Fretibacter rubidus TaxID=570162 RepID=UPI00352BA67F